MTAPDDLPPVPPGGERQELSKEEFYKSLLNDIDPAKLAGEGWGNIDEYARPADIDSPWVRADIEQDGEYYPTPKRRR